MSSFPWPLPSDAERVAISRAPRVRPFNQKSDDRHSEMEALFCAGKTLQEIGSAFGVSRQRVQAILAGRGVSRSDGGIAKRASAKRDRSAALADERSIKKFGCTVAEYKRILALGVTRAYSQHRSNAAVRGIEWGFNLWTWWKVWDASGKWNQRGRGKGFVMARNGDAGPYGPDNVRIITGSENVKESYIHKPWSERNVPWKDRPRGALSEFERFVHESLIAGKSKAS